MRSRTAIFIFIGIIFLSLIFCPGCGSTAPASLPPPSPPATPTDIDPIAPPPSSGNTYYVSPGGNNSNPGTHDLPWAMPGYGSRQLHPGDTLIILGGRYVLSQYDDDIITPPSGMAETWITIKGEDGNRPVLAGRDNLYSAINLAGVSYVKIENLEITHDATASGEGVYSRGGISISGAPSSYLILKDLYIHHIDEGAIDAQDVDQLQIIDCRLEYCGFGGIVIDQVEQAGAGFEIINCTLADNHQREAYMMYVQYDEGISPPAVNVTLKNNIIAGGYNVAYFGHTVNLTADHNLFYCPDQDNQVQANGRDYTAAQLSELGIGNISADPLFVRPEWGTTGDYHLQAGSPALDAGTSTGAPSLDLAGTARPQGIAFDIGAYEQ